MQSLGPSLVRIDDLVQSLDSLATDAERGQVARGHLVFARTSLRFVLELAARLEDGRFDDPDWVRGLLLEVDDRYVQIVRGAVPRPAPWQVACGVAATDPARAMKNLLLGIHAHIAYDLVAALSRRVAPPHQPRRRRRQREDFARINDIIHLAVDGVQQEIRARGPRWLTFADAALLRFDELGTWLAFTLARGRAFDVALKVADGELSLFEVEARAAVTARVIAMLPA
jgi:hypothetical protein